MKHPHREEWVPYLFSEADPETKKRLAAHLNACPDCAAELHGWRMSLQRLDGWKMQETRPWRLPVHRPVFTLAAAALLVLGLGFMGGRWFSAADTRSDLARVKAEAIAASTAETTQ